VNYLLIQHSNHSFKEIFMKRITTIIILLSILLNWSCRLEEIPILESSCNEETETTFEKRYNYLKNSLAWDVAETQDGNFIVCGSYNNDTPGDDKNHISLMKLNNEGDTLFLRFDKDPVNGVCRSVTVTQENDFLICGEKGGNPYFARYDETGNLFDDGFTAPDDGECNCVVPQLGTPGRYLFTGRRPKANAAGQSAYSGTLNLQGGNIGIFDEYKPPLKSKKENTFQIVRTIASDGYAVIGNSFNGNSAPDGTRYMYFYKLNNNLNLIEDTEQFYNLDTSNDVLSTIGRGIVANADGTYTVGGFSGSNIFMLHLDENGEFIIKYDYGGAGDQIYSIIEAHETDQYVMCGISGTQLFLTKVAHNGQVEWGRTYGQVPTYEAGYAVKRTKDCGYILTGYSRLEQFNAKSESQAYAIKVDSEGRR